MLLLLFLLLFLNLKRKRERENSFRITTRSKKKKNEEIFLSTHTQSVLNNIQNQIMNNLIESLEVDYITLIFSVIY